MTAPSIHSNHHLIPSTILGILLTLACGAAVPESARAQPFSWQIDESISSPTKAGTNPQVTVTMASDDDINEDDLSDVALDFPDGLIPVATGFEYCNMIQNPDGTVECTNPNAQAIGAQVLRVALEILPIYTDIDADLYLEQPGPGEAAAMVAIPKTQFPFPVIVEIPKATVQLKASGWGIQIVTSDIPNQATVYGTPLDIHISKIELTLDGSVKNGSGVPLLTVPAICDPVSFDATLTSYAGEVRTDAEPFPITDCQGVPYGPKLSLSLSSSQAGAATNLVTTAEASPAEAPTRELKIELPAGFSLAPSTVKACTLAEVAAKACPSHSAIGAITVPNPIAAGDLQGTVYQTEPKGDAIGVWVLISASFGQIEINGTIRQPPGGNTELAFTDFPPLGVGNVNLSVSPSSGGTFLNPFSCGTYNATSLFTSHNNRQVTQTHPLAIGGCELFAQGTPTTLTVSLTKPVANRHTDAKLKVTQLPRAVEGATFLLPAGLAVKRRQPRGVHLAYLELWSAEGVRRGMLMAGRQTRRSLRLVAKNGQLRGLNAVVEEVTSRSHRGSQSTQSRIRLTQIPGDEPLTDFSLQLFGRRTLLLRTFRKCHSSRTLTFRASVTTADDMQEASSPVQVRCPPKTTGALSDRHVRRR